MCKDRLLRDEELLRTLGRLEHMKEEGAYDDINRDYLFCRILCFSDLSVDEIRVLKWEDIDFQMLEIHVRSGVKARDIHLQSEIIKAMESFKNREGYLFPFSEEKADVPMTQKMLSEMWDSIAARMEIEGVTPKAFKIAFNKMFL